MKHLKTFEDYDLVILDNEENIEILEKKKINPGFQAYLDKQKAKKEGKESDKKDTKKDEKDCDKKECKDEVKSAKGLTAKQKKLPPALQASILKKQKK